MAKLFEDRFKTMTKLETALGFKKDDIVTGYYPGIWMILGIYDYPTGESTPQVDVLRLVSDDFRVANPQGKIIRRTHALSYCKRLTTDDILKDLKNIIGNVLVITQLLNEKEIENESNLS